MASDASPHYGLGWFVDVEKRTVWHSGSTPGVETLATMLPADRKGVVVLVNAGSGLGFRESSHLFDGITARALPRGCTGSTPRVARPGVSLAREDRQGQDEGVADLVLVLSGRALGECKSDLLGEVSSARFVRWPGNPFTSLSASA